VNTEAAAKLERWSNTDSNTAWSKKQLWKK